MHPVVEEECTLHLNVSMTASFEGQKLFAEKISPSVQLHKLPSTSVFEENLKLYTLPLGGYFIERRKASVRLQCNNMVESTFQTCMLVQLAGYRGHSFVEACFHEP